MRTAVLCIAAFLFSSCSPMYPYRISNEGCNCERYVYSDRRNFDMTFSARYEVSDRIASVIEIEVNNRSNDTLDLRQAFVKITSENVLYLYNDKFQPLPHVAVPPHDTYTITLRGSDTEIVPKPWLKMVGERLRIELRRITLGASIVDPILITLVPVNPHFQSSF